MVVIVLNEFYSVEVNELEMVGVELSLLEHLSWRGRCDGINSPGDWVPIVTVAIVTSARDLFFFTAQLLSLRSFRRLFHGKDGGH